MEIQLTQLDALSKEAKSFGKIILIMGGIGLIMLLLLMFKVGDKR